MIDLLASPPFLLFSVSFGVALAFLLLEIAVLLLGGTLVGLGDSSDAAGEIDLDFDGADAMDLPDGNTEALVQVEDAGGILAWMGLGKAPFLIWFSGLTLSFGALGIFLQTIALEIFAPLPAVFAFLFVLPPSLWLTRKISLGFAAVFPKVESSSVDRRRLGGKRGQITQGTATAERPAEARVRDIHGNLHHIRVRAQPGVEIARGTDVIIKSNRDGTFVAIPFAE